MKRHVWWTTGLGLMLVMAACGGSGSDESGLDGDAGTGNFSDQLDPLRDHLNDLGKASDEFDSRVTALETPPTPSSCSAGELCIPDGVNLVESGLEPMIHALCAYETGCCSPNELNYLYGPALKSSADCEATFVDLINSGQVDGAGVFVGNLYNLSLAAHALNDPQVSVTIDAAAVSACAAELSAQACPQEAATQACTPKRIDAESACSLANLLKGREPEGSLCQPGEINECGAGLVCRDVTSSSSGGQTGLCAAKASAGDRCVRTDDCDDLYCDFASGTCKTRAKEGEACSYIDPSFKDGSLYGVWQLESDELTLVDCEFGLTCNPSTNTCVKGDCASGSFCQSNAQCPSGTVCSALANDALHQWTQRHQFVGLCVSGLTSGATCEARTFNNSLESDCASQRCEDPDDDGRATCQAAALTDGQTCKRDTDCVSGLCGTNQLCAATCDFYCDGDACKSCAAGSYCHTVGNGSWCLPAIALGESCDAWYPHASCASGFCDAGLCDDKSTNGSCPSGLPEECPNGQGCLNNTCVAGAALGAACSAPGSFGSECVAGTYCSATAGSAANACVKLSVDRSSLRDLANGSFCRADEWCKSDWCKGQGTVDAACADPSPGAACNPQLASSCGAKAVCLPGTTPDSGTCQPYRELGEPCAPELFGAECASRSCVSRHDAFLCSPGSESDAYCH